MTKKTEKCDEQGKERQRIQEMTQWASGLFTDCTLKILSEPRGRQQPHSKHPASTQQASSEHPESIQQTPSNHPASTQQPPSTHPASTQQHPASTQQASSKHPASTQRAPSQAPSEHLTDVPDQPVTRSSRLRCHMSQKI
jgi:hypothetical protein